MGRDGRRPDGASRSLRDEQKRFTRRRLIEGALAAFDEKGYAATTIEDIVDAANASRATFYLHFKSKADVVLTLNRTLDRHWRELYGELAANGVPSREDLVAWLDDMVTNYQTHRATVHAINQAVAVEPEVAAEVQLGEVRAVDAIADSIVRWYGAGMDDARIRALMLLAQMDRSLYFWLVRGVPFDRARAVATLADAWLAVLHLTPHEAPQPA